ncbi:MAG: hypothetical protein J6Y72_11680 [Bacteroidales bacterium]|nr:hypothetical protein [Bacteroidales bacterium]
MKIKTLLTFFAATLFSVAAYANEPFWAPQWSWDDTPDNVVYYDNSTNYAPSSGYMLSTSTNGFGHYAYTYRHNNGQLDIAYIIKESMSISENHTYVMQFDLENWELTNGKLTFSLVNSTEENATVLQTLGEYILTEKSEKETKTIEFTAKASGACYLQVVLTGPVNQDYKNIMFECSDFKATDDNDYSITTSEGITCEVATAKRGESVTVSVAKAPEGYYLQDIRVVENGTGNIVSAKGATWYSDGTATFTMPGDDVTVTPVYTDKDIDWSIYMPQEGTTNVTLPLASKVFHIYDDGGASYDYSKNCNGYVVLTAPEGYRIKLTGTVNTEGKWDYLSIDPYGVNKKYYSNEEGEDLEIEPFISASNTLTLYFYSDYSGCYSGLNLTATLLKVLEVSNINNIANQTYTGEEIKPAVVVVDGQTTLTENVDYTIAYSNNVNAGTATVTVTGIGDYTGEVKVTFTIDKATTTFTAVERQTINCLQTLADVTLPEGYRLVNAEQTLTIGDNTIALYYNPDENNYEDATGNMTVVVEHKTVVTDEAVAATCTEAAITEGSHCEACHTTVVAQTSVGEPLGHEWGEWQTVVASTCSTNGSQKRVCSRDESHVDTQDLPFDPSNHEDVVTDEAVAATCTEAAITEGSHCEACHTTIVAQTSVGEPLGHSFTHYVYNNDATKLADGTETAECDHGCGTTDTRVAVGTMLPGSVTTVNEVDAEKQHAKKYIENGMLIIEVNGVKYDITGRVVK